jgi:hypothetical protein
MGIMSLTWGKLHNPRRIPQEDICWGMGENSGNSFSALGNASVVVMVLLWKYRENAAYWQRC